MFVPQRTSPCTSDLRQQTCALAPGLRPSPMGTADAACWQHRSYQGAHHHEGLALILLQYVKTKVFTKWTGSPLRERLHYHPASCRDIAHFLKISWLNAGITERRTYGLFI